MTYATLETQRQRTARLHRKHLIERMTTMPENHATERKPRYVVEFKRGPMGYCVVDKMHRIAVTFEEGMWLFEHSEAQSRAAAQDAAAEAEEEN